MTFSGENAARFGLLGLAALVLTALPPSAQAQQAADKKPSSKTSASSRTAQKNKLKLLEVTRVSTRQAARKAAEAEVDKKTGTAPDSKQAAAIGVVELQPNRHPEGKQANQNAARPGKKSLLKNVHGSVYGATGASNSDVRRTGGDVGATTKGGKASVYVQAEKNRSNPGPPQ